MNRTICTAKRLMGFFKREEGAITVDWIVLTASLVFMGMAAAFYVSSSVPVVADKTADYMRDYEIGG